MTPSRSLAIGTPGIQGTDEGLQVTSSDPPRLVNAYRGQRTRADQLVHLARLMLNRAATSGTLSSSLSMINSCPPVTGTGLRLLGVGLLGLTRLGVFGLRRGCQGRLSPSLRDSLRSPVTAVPATKCGPVIG